jgi:FixJ family two-component response regulator
VIRASRKCLVAVVDDDESVRRALGRLIRSYGYEAEVFPSAGAFLASLSSHAPDCLVLDLHMPDVDGFETQSRLAELRVPVPVVVITGHDTPEAHARAMAGGARAYLRKPIDQRVLLEAIRNAVGGNPATTET